MWDTAIQEEELVHISSYQYQTLAEEKKWKSSDPSTNLIKNAGACVSQ